MRHSAADATDQLVIQAVVDIARGLGKRTVAEHVGDGETAALLHRMGVDHAQGFHLGKPGPAGRLAARGRGRADVGSRSCPRRPPIDRVAPARVARRRPWISCSLAPCARSSSASRVPPSAWRARRSPPSAPGLLVLLGVTHDDTEAQADRLADKLRALRVFPDAEGG